ncbi:MAG: A/G-specific adenine glycosylase [Dehalococcoidia bacterium]
MQETLLKWFQSQQRDLPWRHTHDPYAILVAEVMLQQTQVDRVIPKYREFFQRFPTLQALAEAPTAQVIRTWAPLGYNRRAVRLQRLARTVVSQYGGHLPQKPQELLHLEGIGPYTAAALACFAFGEDVAVLDTNARRVLGRLFFGVKGGTPQQLRVLADEVLPQGQSWAWSQALMDLGAILCTRQRPRCLLCPLRPRCRAYPELQRGVREVAEAVPTHRPHQAPFYGSTRYYRGRIVERLRGLEPAESLSLESLGRDVKPGFTTEDASWLLQLLQGLERDGLLVLRWGSTEGTLVQLQVALP